jgi:coenzyme F420-dependent glucose-6-phosphate dehydrogenase
VEVVAGEDGREDDADVEAHGATPAPVAAEDRGDARAAVPSTARPAVRTLSAMSTTSAGERRRRGLLAMPASTGAASAFIGATVDPVPNNCASGVPTGGGERGRRARRDPHAFVATEWRGRMASFGYFASLEEFSPAACLDQVELAEAAGFDSVWVNDHFHPWFDHLADGSPAHGGNCWSWMPVALERTSGIEVGTGVTAILNRYHPANVAHRLATLLELYPDRVFLGLGTGEALNESPLGNPWPEYGERARRTAEAIRLIRRLFAGEFVDFDGRFWSLDGANLYTGPDEAPPIHIAGNGPTSARMAGDLGDGFVTVYEDPDRIADELFPAVDAGVERSGHNETGDDVEKTVLVHCSFAETERAAIEPCKPWRLTLLPVFFDQDIADPRYLQRHGERVGIEYLKEAFVITTDPQDLVDVAGTYFDCGFDRVVFQSSSPDQARFCEVMETEVMPSFD